MNVPQPYFVASGAVVVGDVKCGPGVNVWFGCVVRGDVAPIILGENVNLQDGTIVHCDFDVPNVIEDHVVAGHRATLHGKRIGTGSLIGMGATLLGGTDIGEESVIAAGAVVPPGMVVPPRSVVMGIPGKVVRQARPEEIEQTRIINRRYRELAKRYLNGEFRPVPTM